MLIFVFRRCSWKAVRMFEFRFISLFNSCQFDVVTFREMPGKRERHWRALMFRWLLIEEVDGDGSPSPSVMLLIGSVTSAQCFCYACRRERERERERKGGWSGSTIDVGTRRRPQTIDQKEKYLFICFLVEVFPLAEACSRFCFY